MAKNTFRKMYFICTEKKVISHNVHMTNAYQYLETANSVCKQRNTHKMWEDKDKPVSLSSVEAFYLVPEALYEKVIKPHVED